MEYINQEKPVRNKCAYFKIPVKKTFEYFCVFAFSDMLTNTSIFYDYYI